MSQEINDDWRLHGQEGYLSNATLYWRPWTQTRPHWDHDHCDFCGSKFAAFDGPDILHEGYTTDDEYYWVCGPCATDFASRFQFRLVGGPTRT